jgi:hypothetical protein
MELIRQLRDRRGGNDRGVCLPASLTLANTAVSLRGFSPGRSFTIKSDHSPKESNIMNPLSPSGSCNQKNGDPRLIQCILRQGVVQERTKVQLNQQHAGPFFWYLSHRVSFRLIVATRNPQISQNSPLTPSENRREKHPVSLPDSLILRYAGVENIPNLVKIWRPLTERARGVRHSCKPTGTDTVTYTVHFLPDLAFHCTQARPNPRIFTKNEGAQSKLNLSSEMSRKNGQKRGSESQNRVEQAGTFVGRLL